MANPTENHRLTSTIVRPPRRIVRTAFALIQPFGAFRILTPGFFRFAALGRALRRAFFFAAISS
jgi:hypothetical protein